MLKHLKQMMSNLQKKYQINMGMSSTLAGTAPCYFNPMPEAFSVDALGMSMCSRLMLPGHAPKVLGGHIMSTYKEDITGWLLNCSQFSF